MSVTWPTPAGRPGRALATVNETAASTAAKHEAEALRLGMESVAELLAMLQAVCAQASEVERLKFIPPGLQQIAEKVAREANIHADAIVGITANLSKRA